LAGGGRAGRHADAAEVVGVEIGDGTGAADGDGRAGAAAFAIRSFA
jgi:hypothetical protein